MKKKRILLGATCVASAVLIAAICGDLLKVDAGSMQIAMPVAALLMILPHLVRMAEIFISWVFSPVPPRPSAFMHGIAMYALELVLGLAAGIILYSAVKLLVANHL